MSVDRSQLQALIRDFGEVPGAVKRSTRAAILEIGQPILDRMRENASWSSRIPAAISMRPSGSAIGVQYRVSAAKVPHARPYENGGDEGEFRAPRWGDREHWYPHQARPFFYRAVEEGADQAAERLGDAAMRAAEEHLG